MESWAIDAPEALGQVLIKAVRKKDATRVRNLLRRNYLWGKYTAQLTSEERRWALEVGAGLRPAAEEKM